MEENNQPQNQEQINVAQNVNVEPKFTPLGQVNENVPKKKKSKVGAIIVILLILAAIIGGLAYYYFQIYTNPKVVYQQMIKSGINNLTAPSTITEELSTVKAKIKADVEIELDESYLDEDVEEIIDLVNDIEATVGIQMDINEEKMILNLDSNYDKEQLLKVDALMDAKNEKFYAVIEPIFEDVIEFEETDMDYSELQDSFKEIQDSIKEQESTYSEDVARKKAANILNKEFSAIIKDEYCSKEKEKITINGKEINADKYVLTMTYEQMINEYITVFKNLKNNEEFLNCFKEKEEVKEFLGDFIEQFEELDIDEYEMTLSVKLYRAGIKQEFVRVDFEAKDDEESVVVKVEKSDDTYAYEVNEGDEVVFSGTAKIEELDEATKVDMTLKIEDMIELALNMEVSASINEQLDVFETKDAKKLEDFTEDEQQEVYDNLENSKLYELVEKFSGASLETPVDGDNTEEPSVDDGETEQIPDQSTISGTQENSTSVAMTKEGKLLVFAKNNTNTVADMDIEVEFYDENGNFVGSDIDYVTAVAPGNEIVVEMYNTPTKFSTYKIYVNEEETYNIEYFDEVETTHNNNGEEIAVQVKNNSSDEIDYITVAVVFYNNGEIVGFSDGIASAVKAGRSGNFNIYYPYDANYDDVEFDDYKVYVTEVYSYNW